MREGHGGILTPLPSGFPFGMYRTPLAVTQLCGSILDKFNESQSLR